MSKHEKSTLPETKKRIITLADLIDANRSIPQQYKILQEQRPVLETPTNTTPFSEFWRRNLDLATRYEDDSVRGEAQRFFKEHLNQQVLIDLGGGQVSFRDKKILRARPMAELAKNCGATIYINVDTGHSDPVYEDNLEGLHIIEVKEDMLSFVARMKNDSANFTLNGIVLRMKGDYRYFEALQNEIVRATRRGGIIFGTESDVAFYELANTEEAPLRSVKLRILGNGNAFLYEKK